MNLTSSDIEQDFYDLLKGSSIETAISGKIYKSGMRPFNSQLEDIVITFLAGISNQVQSGVVLINTYVPNILIEGNSIKDTARCKALEALIKEWISLFSSTDYIIELNRTIQVFEEAEIQQHFINTRISFKILTE